jgi:hypothetical protein
MNNIPSAAHSSARMIVAQIDRDLTEVQILLRQVRIGSKNLNERFRNVKSARI